jgi:membrane-associated protease RseP (regulator of RpoE activity)
VNPPHTAHDTASFEDWVAPQTRSFALPLFLLGITICTTLIAGADLISLFQRDLPYTVDTDRYIELLRHPARWLDGWVFSLPLLLILGAHELGHFLACEYYRVDATYPYFVPVPTPIGTMGAFIRIKAPIYSRRALFDIAVAGPLAGFAILLPVLLVGVTLSRVHHGLAENSDIVYGIPAIIRLLEAGIFHGIRPEDVYLHPVARAAWVGLLATALNLLPIGQLDGGHLLYAWLGEPARIWFRAFWVGLLGLAAFFDWHTWLPWAILLFFLGMKHPTIYGESPLGTTRGVLTAAAIVIFVLSFSTIPVHLSQ